MTRRTPAFTCRRCGHCCQGEGGIVLTLADQERLARHLGLSVEQFLSTYAAKRSGKVQLTSKANGVCVFFAQGCGVHQARPDICRAWPFFRGNLLDKGSWAMIQEYCPGVNPEAGFEEFVRQGLEYMHANGLARDGDDSAPCALRLGGVPCPGRRKP